MSLINQRRFALDLVDRPPNDVPKIWDAFVEHLRKHHCCPVKFKLSNVSDEKSLPFTEQLILPPEGISEQIAKRCMRGFSVSTIGIEKKSIGVTLRAWGDEPPPSRLEMWAETAAKIPTDWNEMIEAVSTLAPVYAGFQYDLDYKTWQNASRLDNWNPLWGPVPNGYRRTEDSDPEVIRAHFGKRYVWLDVCKNPGRACQKDHKPYQVTAEMWLGPGFWTYAPCTKEEVLAADFFLEKRDTPHYLYLKSWPRAFTRPDGEQGRVQQRLWRLLYHEDCEWPPGSSGISDIPIGGPPELMPQ